MSNNIVTLGIFDSKNKNVIKKLFLDLFNNPQIVKNEFNGTVVENLIYNKFRSNMHWSKIFKKLNSKIEYILCGESINVPPIYGFRKFYSNEFYRHLCKCAVNNILKLADLDPFNLKLSLYDPRAGYFDILKFLVRYSERIKVITNNIEIYENNIKELDSKYQEFVSFSTDINIIEGSHIVVAPDKIRLDFNLNESSYVFTSEEPGVVNNCHIIKKYMVNTPSKYVDMIPDYLEHEYFLSYLYFLCEDEEVCKLEPTYCLLDENVRSLRSVANEVKNCIEHDQL